MNDYFPKLPVDTKNNFLLLVTISWYALSMSSLPSIYLCMKLLGYVAWVCQVEGLFINCSLCSGRSSSIKMSVGSKINSNRCLYWKFLCYSWVYFLWLVSPSFLSKRLESIVVTTTCLKYFLGCYGTVKSCYVLRSCFSAKYLQFFLAFSFHSSFHPSEVSK